jgi:hypothetical protein
MCVRVRAPFLESLLGGAALQTCDLSMVNCVWLKVPKREIFVTELYTLSDPIWVGDLETEAKNPFL